MRKKGIACLLMLSLFMVPVIGVAKENTFGLSDEVIMNNLKKMDLTRTSWDSDAYLTRKEALTLAYIIKNALVPGTRIYADFVIEEIGMTNEEWEDGINNYLQNAKEGIPYYHMDLKTVEDYWLDVSLVWCQLYTGILIDEQYYAQFEREITYEEALAVVERMIASTREELELYDVYQPMEGFYNRAEQAGIINGSMLFCPNLKVTEEMLNEKIPIKDFMRLLYTGLFIYREDSAYEGDIPNRFISNFSFIKNIHDQAISGLNAKKYEEIENFFKEIGIIEEVGRENIAEISRREATEIAYRIKKNGGIDFNRDEGAKNLKNIEKRPEEYVKIGLLKGREENGKTNLALEESMTNEEGLIVILRMLNNENGNIGGQQLQTDENTDVFAIAEEEKLINVNEEAFGKSIQMTREEIKEPLTYGTFYNLVNDSLYIPRTFNKEKEIYGRYIEQYIEIPEKEKEENVDIKL